MAIQTAPDIGRLAQYRPWDRGGLDLRAVLHDLIVAVACINDGEVSSLLNCRDCFADLWGLEVEVDELRPVVEDLLASSDATKVGSGFKLSPKRSPNSKHARPSLRRSRTVPSGSGNSPCAAWLRV
jgi:hypothetical protein